MKTESTKQKDIKRDWHLVDVSAQVLGRVATQIAQLLMGKNKPYFVRYLDCGDYVVVINAKNVLTTGKKEEKKVYRHHSGYPGGLKEKILKDLRREKPAEIITHAVSGMLPKNKLRKRMLGRLYVFADDKHPYGQHFV